MVYVQIHTNTHTHTHIYIYIYIYTYIDYYITYIYIYIYIIYTHIYTCMYIQIHVNIHPKEKKTIRNFIIAAINCVLLRSGLNVTWMERHVTEFEPYLDVFLIGISSNIFWAPLTLWLRWSLLVSFQKHQASFCCLIVDKYTAAQSNYIIEFHNSWIIKDFA